MILGHGQKKFGYYSGEGHNVGYNSACEQTWKSGKKASVAKSVKRRTVEWMTRVLQCQNHHCLVSVTAP